MMQSKEQKVDANAFLVSKTDTTGKITYCNEPFLKIVGARQSELLGKPHNIVRHPDMPRVIFKFLWEYIKNKREIFAYVKNRSFDGSFYWVFANITASLDNNGKIVGYYSVRRKPNEKALQIIEPLYKQLKSAEQNGGIEASQMELEKFLAQKQTTYDEFVNKLQRLI
ncbi:PAS domain-containing protein [Campylobacter sp. faydin G-24]|uniref:PAS domain-containing protein n=1 Tax=Campylobacter anatolicus TaxID=2829105 RepID=A0ABS5HIF3_9BACT|nr:PAS domain-containing protein [Campylobacter anatolicus]MBR8464054.1 PAS domain-containing protein [Campylobacter anatolicus]MBR8465959.1 PAS domain-containing protein [Campylobacter anatolicus]